jgi:hypothetical protein
VRRALLVLLATSAALLVSAAPAGASAKCLLVPDLEGNVWTVCLR